MSIFAIKKKEPADYEPPHSAGIAYPSLKIIQYGIVLHINIFVPFRHLMIMMMSRARDSIEVSESWRRDSQVHM